MSKPRKTKFIRFVGGCAICHHSVELRAEDGGKALLRHDRGFNYSGKFKTFESLPAAEEWLDSFGLGGAQLLNKVLGELGVDGFPSN